MLAGKALPRGLRSALPRRALPPTRYARDVRGRSPLFWILLTLGIGAVGLALDKVFADNTAPYEEPPIAYVGFFLFFLFGLAFVVRGPLSWGFTVGSASAVLTMMVLPVMIVATREALRAVPSSLRDGAYALGATKWQTISKQVLSAATPGIATGSILGVSRALGESAPLILLGALAYVSSNPTGFDSDYTVLPLAIFKYATEAQLEFRAVAAAAIIVLLVLLVALNMIAILIRDRSRKSW